MLLFDDSFFMKKVFILSLFCSLSVLASASYNATDSLMLKNADIITRSKQLITQAEIALITNKVDSSFTFALIKGLTTIMQEAVVRGSELRDVQNLQEKRTSIINQRRMRAFRNENALKTHQYKIDTAYTYCAASARILGMIDAFSKNKKAYFAPGKYIIPYNLRPIAKKVYSPIVDSMEALVLAYPQLSFDGMLRTTGYSDASPTPKGSMLYRDMVQRMKFEPLETEEINQYLSYLRSYDVADILKEMTKENRVLRNVDIHIDRQGKGSALPDLKNKYSERDERRRSVRVYWHILPKF